MPDNKKYYIHTIVVFFLMFCFGNVVPPFGQVTTDGMQVIGVFLGLLYGWTFIGFLWPSLLSFIAIGLTGLTTISAALTAGFGANLTLVLIFIFIFAKYLEDSGLNEYIGYWFISRKIAVGKPWVFTLLFMLCAFFLAIVTNLFASIVVCWSIFFKITGILNIKEKTKYVAVVLFGVVVSATFGSMAVPFQAVPLASIKLYEQAIGESVNFLLYSGLCISMSIILICVYLLLCRFIVRPDVSFFNDKADYFAEYRNAKMNPEIKLAAVMLCILLLLVFLPNILPKTFFITTFLSKFGLLEVVILCLIALLVVKKANGESIIDFSVLAAKGINWDIVVVIACTTPVCNALESEQAGVLTTFLNWATPIMGSLAPYTLLAFVIVSILIMTQFAHNMVLCIIFVPLLSPLLAQLGISPIAALIAIIFAAHVAYATPAASTQVAMVYANTKWINTKDIYQLVFLYVPIVLLCYLVILIPILLNFV